MRSLVTIIYIDIRNKLRSAPLRLSEEQEGLMVTTKRLCVMKIDKGRFKSTIYPISTTDHQVKSLPSKHHFLATLFSKILLLSPSRSHAYIITIHRKGDTHDCQLPPHCPNISDKQTVPQGLAIGLENYVILTVV